MTGFEAGVLTLLAKAVFVLVTAACIVQFAILLQGRRGRHALVPVLVWLGWLLASFLGALAVLALANAHTHADSAVLVIRIIAAVYLALGSGLLVHLGRRIGRRHQGTGA
jgi:NADH:ubiquinone oxidoreductase subunit K